MCKGLGVWAAPALGDTVGYWGTLSLHFCQMRVTRELSPGLGVMVGPSVCDGDPTTKNTTRADTVSPHGLAVPRLDTGLAEFPPPSMRLCLWTDYVLPTFLVAVRLVGTALPVDGAAGDSTTLLLVWRSSPGA